MPDIYAVMGEPAFRRPTVAAVPPVAGARVLDDALACLPERDREVLLLAAWEGLAHDTIAGLMGCSRPNVAARLHRAERRLDLEIERLEPPG